MKAYEGYKAEKSFTNEALPAGGYVAKIMGTKIEEYSWGDVFIISFDILEGEYKDFFANQYRANTDENKKWKGNYRLNIPSEKSKYPESDKKRFNNAMWAVEESNKGYHWDWNENTLKDKKIGVMFRNKEFEKNDGTTGWFSECCSVIDIESIKNGKFKTPKDKPLSNKTNNTVERNISNSDFEEIPDEDLPF